MIVTVNTDASFSFKHKVGSYAFWIVCNDFKIKMSGPLKHRVERAEIAEFRCLINAFDVMFRYVKTKPTKIIVNTDCLNVIHVMTGNKEAIKRFGLSNKHGFPSHRRTLQNLIKNNGFDLSIVEYRHIKSHQHTDTARNYVNQWCDDEAKSHMTKLISDKELIS